MPATYHTLRLILGDQLNHQHTWYQTYDAGVLYALMETRSETDYARHHVQKVVGFFLAMRHFASWLRDEGHAVVYLQLDDPNNQQSITDNLRMLLQREGIEQLAYQLPDEYRLDEALRNLGQTLPKPPQVVDTEHFLSTRQTLAELFAGKKTYLMETFYRHMRRRWQIMMEADGQTPLTGRWNYDQENRRSLPPDQTIPPPPTFVRGVRALTAMLQAQGVDTFGDIDPDQFTWPVTRPEALDLLDHFVRSRLWAFGAYQDAMTQRDSLLFHSKLSFVLNIKLLHPLEVVQACVGHWHAHPTEVDIAQVEGFVRQVIGWREYMRGVYWAQMPGYAQHNYFEHTAPLPGFYWTGQTRMRCLGHAIGQSLRDAYAHHIQRLMLTGNFALLLGVHPDEVDAWYLGIYMDAIEWVEITNTRGMSQFADGGLVATKPYVSGANYIHKMSDYCQGCTYDRTAKTGPRACPFNSLYWDFMDRHRSKLATNPRIGMVYRNWDRMPAEQRAAVLERAAWVKAHADTL